MSASHRFYFFARLYLCEKLKKNWGKNFTTFCQGQFCTVFVEHGEKASSPSKI